MHRYHSLAGCLLGSALVLTGCALPTPRENVDVAAELVRSRSRANLEWRRDPAADEAARKRAAEILDAELTPEGAVAVSFLVSPELQVVLEQLAIPRAQLMAAMTPPNPVGVIGSRKPGGDLAVFYPERAISIGVLMNLMALLNMPDRVAIARLDLQRAQYAAAQEAATHAAKVVEAWLECSAALGIWQLYERAEAGGPRSPDGFKAELAAGTARARLAALMGVTGWRDDWKIAAGLPPPPAADPAVEGLEALAMKQRLDLLAASKAVDVRLRTLAMQRRFRWVNQLDAGMFRDKAIGGTAFTGPNAVVEIPIFDQRVAQLLQSDAELHLSVRQLEAARITALTEIRIHLEELRVLRQWLKLYEDPVTEAQDPGYTEVLQEYWRARSALAFSAGDWGAISGL